MTRKIGRPRSCECGECRKCRRRDYMRWYYHSTEERKSKAQELAREHYRRKVTSEPAFRMAERARDNDKFIRLGQKIQKNRIKTYARDAIAKALMAGNIIRPSSCSVCGVQCRIEGHHEDYNRPMDVWWLCSECHGRAHWI